MTTTLNIGGMTCQNCVKHVREALLAVPGVKEADVDLDAGKARVEHESGTQPQQLVAVVVEEGYEAGIQ
jgi:copper chaperone CopZ